MTLSMNAQPLAYGVPIHAGEHQRYLDRTRTSWELLNRTRDLIPTGHAGGMWYQMPYPVLLSTGLTRRREPGSGSAAFPDAGWAGGAW